MFFMMSVMTVSSVHQRTRHLHDSVEMNENKRANRERAGRCQRAGCGSTPMRFFTRDQSDEFADRKLAEQVAEEDEKKERPEKRQKAIGVLLESRAEDFNPQKFQDRFEKVFRPGRGIGLRLLEHGGEDGQH